MKICPILVWKIDFFFNSMLCVLSFHLILFISVRPQRIFFPALWHGLDFLKEIMWGKPLPYSLFNTYFSFSFFKITNTYFKNTFNQFSFQLINISIWTFKSAAAQLWQFSLWEICPLVCIVKAIRLHLSSWRFKWPGTAVEKPRKKHWLNVFLK